MIKNAQRPFLCARCGRCCRVPGYVRITTHEVDNMARFVGMAVREFTDRYTRLTTDRGGLSLIEAEDGACIFLQRGGECAIHPVKPRQCRDFPLAWSFPGYESICRGSATP